MQKKIKTSFDALPARKCYGQIKKILPCISNTNFITSWNKCLEGMMCLHVTSTKVFKYSNRTTVLQVSHYALSTTRVHQACSIRESDCSIKVPQFSWCEVWSTNIQEHWLKQKRCSNNVWNILVPTLHISILNHKNCLVMLAYALLA